MNCCWVIMQSLLSNPAIVCLARRTRLHRLPRRHRPCLPVCGEWHMSRDRGLPCAIAAWGLRYSAISFACRLSFSIVWLHCGNLLSPCSLAFAFFGCPWLPAAPVPRLSVIRIDHAHAVLALPAWCVWMVAQKLLPFCCLHIFKHLCEF